MDELTGRALKHAQLSDDLPTPPRPSYDWKLWITGLSLGATYPPF